MSKNSFTASCPQPVHLSLADVLTPSQQQLLKSTTEMAPRRTHKKSKLGCEQCKRRHVKCDESRPICANCSTSEFECSYRNQPLPLRPGSTIRSSNSPAATLTPSVGSPESQLSALQNLTVNAEEPFHVNMLHFQLLENFRHFVFRDIFRYGDVNGNQFAEIVYKYALTAPFLMHEVLAVSALHMCTIRPEQRLFYQRHAAGLQTTALKIVNNFVYDDSSENSIAMFSFASLVGMHALAATALFRDESSVPYLDSFIEYMKLHRGVKPVVFKSREVIRNSELQHFFQVAEHLYNKDNLPETADECRPLYNLLTASDISHQTKDIYKKAIGDLQVIFDGEHHVSSVAAKTTSMVFSWIITISPEFIDCLMQRKPEALVILAYYGVLLHRHNDIWLVGDSGQYLVAAITQHLGAFWKSWLEWPNAQLLLLGVEL